MLARKPLVGTVAANVLAHGTGALNIDGCRIAGEDVPEGRVRHGGGIVGAGTSYELPDGGAPMPAGRWPANVIHDGSDEVVAAFPVIGSSFRQGDRAAVAQSNIYGDRKTRDEGWTQTGAGYSDSGSAARFFYSAKADADDRIGSEHPTVKPVDLMQYLVRLVTPKGGLVLDPFAGTGTTGEACIREGMRCVLIEREPEYQADIRKRMKLAMAGPDERKRARTKPAPVEALPLFGGAE